MTYTPEEQQALEAAAQRMFFDDGTVIGNAAARFQQEGFIAGALAFAPYWMARGRAEGFDTAHFLRNKEDPWFIISDLKCVEKEEAARLLAALRDGG